MVHRHGHWRGSWHHRLTACCLLLTLILCLSTAQTNDTHARLWFSSSLPGELDTATEVTFRFIVTSPRPQLANPSSTPPFPMTTVDATQAVPSGLVARVDGEFVSIQRVVVDQGEVREGGTSNAWTGPYSFAASELQIGRHTVEVGWRQHPEIDGIRYTWTVVSSVPTVSILNPPTSQMGTVSSKPDWVGHLGTSTVASKLWCRLISTPLDWGSCCDEVFSLSLDSDCRLACRNGEEHRCLPPHPKDGPKLFTRTDDVFEGDDIHVQPFLQCIARLGKATSVSLVPAASDEWETCSVEINFGGMGSALGSSKLLQVKAAGLGGVEGPVADWHWSVVPPIPLSINESQSSPSMLSSVDGGCPSASTGLTIFAVISWVLVAVLTFVLWRYRAKLEAGWDPVQARLKRTEASTRQVSVSAAPTLQVLPSRKVRQNDAKKSIEKSTAAPNIVLPSVSAIDATEAEIDEAEIDDEPMPVAPPRRKSKKKQAAEKADSKMHKKPSMQPGELSTPPPPRLSTRAETRMSSAVEQNDDQNSFAFVKRKVPTVARSQIEPSPGPAPFAFVKRSIPRKDPNVTISQSDQL